MSSLKISTYYGDTIIVRGNYTPIQADSGIGNPDIPASFEITEVFREGENKLASIDRFLIDALSEICCDMSESEMTEYHITEKMSESIMNNDKYLSHEEQDMLEFIIKQEHGRCGNSDEKCTMLKEIAKKCIQIGLHKEFIDELN